VPLDPLIERRVVAEALAQPGWGSRRISDQLGMRGIVLAASTVYRALKRHHLGTRQQCGQPRRSSSAATSASDLLPDAISRQLLPWGRENAWTYPHSPLAGAVRVWAA
jgi:hypothetical protein